MFNKALLSSIALVALIVCGPVSAADMPAPPSAAPGYYPPPLAPPIYNWAGFYFGGNAGGAWTMSNGPVNSTQTSGFIGGGQVGYNFLLPPSVLLGVEADFDGLTNTNSSITPDGIVQHDAKLNFLSTVRGRVGLTFDRLLVYGTGGVAFTQSDVTRTQLATAGGIPAGTVDQLTNIRTGWTVGGGLEYAFAHNWTAKIEYLFADMGSITNTFPNAGITNGPINLNVNTVRAGINYKFNWGPW
jgi:outer membrane immunogenic protein